MELSRPSRRGFLGGALATTLAWLGCGGSRPAGAGGVTGAIVGRDAARGHLLRGGAPAAAPSRRTRAGVVVVGGGIAGLSAAWALQHHGVDDLLLLELEDSLGGTAVSGANAVSAYPWGAHYLPVPTRSSRACCTLLREMGVITGFDAAGRAIAAEQHLCRAPQERLFYRGRWSEGLFLRDGAGDADRAEYERFYAAVDRWAAERDGGGARPFDIPVAASSAEPAWRELDGISMADWLDREGFRSARLRWYVEYAARDDFGCLLPETSAWAGLHYFASRIAQPGGDGAEFLTWPEGNGFLVRHLAGVLGDRRRTGAVVTRIADGPDGVEVTWVDAATGAATAVVAQQVVCAVPRFIARRIVQGLEAESSPFRYAPWVVANCTLDRPAASHGFPLCWDNVLYDSPSLGYVSATHQSDRAEHATVWTWYRPFCEPDVRASRGRILGLEWAHWRDAVLADLRPAHADIAERVQHIDVWRWGHAMVRPEPGFLWGGAREAALQSRGRVHFAGADLGGLPIFEEAQWTGVRAAELACTALGVDYESML